MKVYVATSYLNQDVFKRFVQVLTQAGHELAYDWTKAGDLGSMSEEEAEQEAWRQYKAINDADAMIAILPGRLGTHTEIGIAAGYTPVFIITDCEDKLKLTSSTPPVYMLKGRVHRRVVAEQDWLKLLAEVEETANMWREDFG